MGVGLIALAGLDGEPGLVMLLYLDNSYERFRAEGRMRDKNGLWYAIHDGAVKCIRPKTMTVVTTFIALIPLMWAPGAGADTIRRLAAPMIGGLATDFTGSVTLGRDGSNSSLAADGVEFAQIYPADYSP